MRESLLDWQLMALLGVGLWLLSRDVAWNLKGLAIYLWHYSITEMHLALCTTHFLVKCFGSPFCLDGAKKAEAFYLSPRNVIIIKLLSCQFI